MASTSLDTIFFRKLQKIREYLHTQPGNNGLSLRSSKKDIKQETLTLINTLKNGYNDEEYKSKLKIG